MNSEIFKMVNRVKKYKGPGKEFAWRGKVLLVANHRVYGFVASKHELEGRRAEYQYIPLEKKLQRKCRAFLRPLYHRGEVTFEPEVNVRMAGLLERPTHGGYGTGIKLDPLPKLLEAEDGRDNQTR